jgi:hypothetical protein
MKDRNLVIRLNVRFGSAADDQRVQSFGLVERAASGQKQTSACDLTGLYSNCEISSISHTTFRYSSRTG